MSDIGAHAAKTGMLANAAIVERLPPPSKPLNTAPRRRSGVMATGGEPLLDDEGLSC